MSKGFNIRAHLGLDSKDYENKIEKAKRSTSNFGSSVKKSVGGAFNSLKSGIDQMTGGALSGFNSMLGGIKGATKGMGGFKAAMAASGIGLFVLAIAGLLQHLKGSAEGQEKLNKLLGGFKGVVGFLQTILDNIGRTLVDMWSNPMTYVKGFWEFVKGNIINRFTAGIDLVKLGIQSIGLTFESMGAIMRIAASKIPLLGKGIDVDAAKADLKEIGKEYKKIAGELVTKSVQLITGADEQQQKKIIEGAKNFGKKTGEAWDNGVEVATKENAFKRAQDEALLYQSQINNKIRKLVKQSREEEKYTEDERKAFLIEAGKLNENLYNSKLDLAQKELDIQNKINSLGPTNIADRTKAVELEATILDIQSEQENAAKGILTELKKYNVEVKAVKDSTEEVPDIIEKIAPVGSIAELENRLKGLKEAFNFADSAEGREELAGQIDTITESLDAMRDTAEEVADTGMEALNGLNETAQILGDTFGFAKDSFAGIASNMLAQLPKMITSINALTNLELLSSKKKIAAKQGEAIAGGTASAAGAPWFMVIPMIAAVIGSIMAMFSSIPKFAGGGVVGGNSFTGDKIMAGLNSGEMVLNGGQQRNLFSMINKGGSNSGNIQFKVKGSDLIGVMNNEQTKRKSF